MKFIGLIILFPLVAMAANPGSATVESVAPPSKSAEPALVLPKIQVSAQRAKAIDQELKRLDKLIARERKKIKSTELDKTLNNEKLARAAAIFGGNSAEHLSAVAASRVMLMEQERMVLEAMKRPATLDERKMMDAEIEQLRLTRRNLDDPAAQR